MVERFLRLYIWGMKFDFFISGTACGGSIPLRRTIFYYARILVTFVTVGGILGGLGLYKYLIDFAGAGATVPLTRFWSKFSQRSYRVS